MYIILGATGHIGSVVAETLLSQAEQVIAVARDADKAQRLKDKGAEIAAVDIHDADALRKVLNRGKRAFLLNPPAPIDTDTDAEERKTVRAILSALEGSGLEKVVGESTMGTQPGDRIGDLSVLYEFEQGLKAQPIPAAINRGAYYFSNWDMQLDSIRETGALSTMFPADFVLPMVAPADLGKAAARRLTSSITDIDTIEIEGPQRYSANDVARIFASVLGRPVTAVATPRAEWVNTFQKGGFSKPAAESYARMTGATVDGEVPPLSAKQKGETSLEPYIRSLVARGSA